MRSPSHAGGRYWSRVLLGGSVVLVALSTLIASVDPGEAATKKKKRHKAAEVEKTVKVEKIPAGPINIVISLKDQQLTLFSSTGEAIASSPVSSGKSGFATPMGVFSILEKNKEHYSNLYGGAPMPNMQRLTWSGIALHGGALPGYPASHGCIRLPYDFARRLFSMTKRFARVIVTRDSVRPEVVSHPSLFQVGPLAPEDVLPGTWRAHGFRLSTAPATASFDTSTEALTAEASLPIAIGDFVRLDNSARSRAASDALAGPGPRAFSIEHASATAVEGELLAAKRALKLAGNHGPISVLVSRKTSKLYVRRNGATLFEAAIAIIDPDRPLGTHVLTAMTIGSEGQRMRWMGLSMPSSYGKTEKQKSAKKDKKKKGNEVAVSVSHRIDWPDAHAALDRIALPKTESARISGLLTAGATLIISDNGISNETGRGTDFIVLTQ